MLLLVRYQLKEIMQNNPKNKPQKQNTKQKHDRK